MTHSSKSAIWHSLYCDHAPHIRTTLGCLGAEDLIADKIPPAVIAKLIEFKMVEINAVGLPQLTPYGAKCFIVIESGDGVVPELKDMAAMEDQARY